MPESRAPVAEAPTHNAAPGLGVYLHIPFCAARCDYCAFATWTDRAHLMTRYVVALRSEIAAARSAGGLAPAATVFVGGGTPSLLEPELLASAITALELAPGAEVTVEANPESVTPALLDALVEAGVTRVSLGVQSLSPHVLDSLGRHHDPDAVARAVALVGESGLPTFNVDLIYGAAGERDEDWAATLAGVLDLTPRPPHVSAYALTVEAGTPLARDRARHPDDDVQVGRYELADEVLAGAGYAWYEISNFAQAGHECRHNTACWQGGDYLGFGCAAHSHRAGRRTANVRDLERYLARVESGASPVAFAEQLDEPARALESLQLALRTRDGVPADAFSPDDVALLGDLLERRGERLVLSRRGRMLANEAALRLRVPASLR